MHTCQRLNYSSSSPRNLEISTVLDIMIATVPTTYIGHLDSKEVELGGGRYNRAAEGCCHSRLTNGKRCLNRSLGY